MNKFPIFCIVIGCSISTSFSASASTLKVLFTADNFINNANGLPTDGVVLGRFTGEDIDNNGFITYCQSSCLFEGNINEVTSFDATWTGNDLLDSFILDFSELELLQYSIEFNRFATRRPIERPFSISARDSSSVPPGIPFKGIFQQENIPFDFNALAVVEGENETGGIEIFTANAFQTEVVPESSTLLGLLVMGSLGLSLTVKRCKQVQ